MNGGYMRLRDLLPYLNENDNILLFVNDEVVEEYDGKNSLSGNYNDYRVDTIRGQKREIRVYLY